MVKKFVKNFLLIGSVLLTLVLVCQLWFSSYFLPGGYDFFVSGFQRHIVNPLVGFFRQMGGDGFSQNLQALFKPEKIVVNIASDRRVITEEKEGYLDFCVLTDSILEKLFSGEWDIKSKTVVDMEAYTAVLRGKSIYVDYGKNCDYRLFSFGVCGELNNRLAEDIGAVRGYVISLQDGIMNDISIYIADQKSGNVVRYTVEAAKTEIEEQMKQFLAESVADGTTSYSFELNFHKEQENATSKILFDPLILMELTPVLVQGIAERTPDEFVGGVSEELLNTVLRTFSINTRTMWHYTELTDARVFVENDATLTLHPDGVLEYQTVDNGRGLELSADKTGYDIYAATDDAMRFVTQLCGHFSPELLENLRIQTDMTDETETPGVYRICFDYQVGGIPVRHRNGDGFAHTIEMKIDNGYLKSYRQYVTYYETTGVVAPVQLPMLGAADILVDTLYQEPNPLMVKKIGLCYAETEGGELVPRWNAVIGETEHIVE